MSLSANELLRTINNSKNEKQGENKLAIVSAIDDSGVYVTFYGEEDASQMPYKRVSSCEAQVGDTVILQRVGTSYIITGKVE